MAHSFCVVCCWQLLDSENAEIEAHVVGQLFAWIVEELDNTIRLDEVASPLAVQVTVLSQYLPGTPSTEQQGFHYMESWAPNPSGAGSRRRRKLVPFLR